MNSHRTLFRHRAAAVALAAPLVLFGAVAGCGGSRVQSPPAAVASTPPVAAAPPQASERPAPPPQERERAGERAESAPPGDQTDDGDEDAELVVSRDVVMQCPSLRMVREHVAELDPDVVWLAVLESLGECMGEGGPMAQVTLGVSGDDEHRRVVREVLRTRGVAPARVVGVPVSPRGVAECQGGAHCAQRVEITIAPAQ